MKIYKAVRKDIPLGWEKPFSESMEGIKDACKKIQEDDVDYLPHYSLVFNAFRCIKPKDVKVVIVGEGPYHTPGLACGLSFSCNDGIPPSLRNIYKELENSIDDFVAPNHGDLSNWCKQGVLLLNIALIAKSGEAGKYPKIWMDLMDSVVTTLTCANRKIIWVMWGNKAQMISKLIGEKGIKLTAAHPSPIVRSGFLGCGHFPIINKTLIDLGKTPIDWTL